MPFGRWRLRGALNEIAMKTRPDCDSAWLVYARGVLGDGVLRSCCQFPVAADRPLRKRVLWPGYIGVNYAKGRVLFVGAMHNAGELFTSEIGALAEVAAQWIRSAATSTTNAHHLEEVRRAYLASIPRWTKGAVWGRFDRIRRRLNLTWEDIAFTNIAKCAEISDANDRDSKKRYNKRITKCTGSFFDRVPLAELQPLAIFVACDNATVRGALEASHQIPIRRNYHNTYGYYRTEVEAGTRATVGETTWLSADADHYAELTR